MSTQTDPSTRGASAVAGQAGPARLFLLRPALYPELYTWYVFLSSLDLLMTWLILHLEGRELNMVADWIIQRYNLPGIVVFKFGLVMFVLLVCETVGRRRDATGRRLARWAIVLSAFPVLVGVTHVLLAALAGQLA